MYRRPIKSEMTMLMRLNTWHCAHGTGSFPDLVISQHCAAYGSSRLGFPESRRAISSEVSKDFIQCPHARYLYNAFHENWAHTRGCSSNNASPSLNSFAEKSPLPFSGPISWTFKLKREALLSTSNSSETAAILVFGIEPTRQGYSGYTWTQY